MKRTSFPLKIALFCSVFLCLPMAARDLTVTCSEVLPGMIEIKTELGSCSIRRDSMISITEPFAGPAHWNKYDGAKGDVSSKDVFLNANVSINMIDVAGVSEILVVPFGSDAKNGSGGSNASAVVQHIFVPVPAAVLNDALRQIGH